MTMIESITEKAWKGERLTKEEALVLWERADFYTLATLAHHRRLALHPESIVTYVIDRNINYTNICISGCRFCAFLGQMKAMCSAKGNWQVKSKKLYPLAGPKSCCRVVCIRT